MASCRSSVNPFGHSMQQPVNCYFEYEQLTWTLHENKTPVDFTRVYSQKHPVLNWIPSQKSVGLEHSQRILSCIRDMVCAWQMFLSASSSQMGAHMTWKPINGTVVSSSPFPAWAELSLSPGKVSSPPVPAQVQVVLLAGGWEFRASFLHSLPS